MGHLVGFPVTFGGFKVDGEGEDSEYAYCWSECRNPFPDHPGSYGDLYPCLLYTSDNPRDAQQAVDLGAEGIGLCRTEHMFFAEDRIKAVREMICARTVEEREAALAKVEPFQQGDFEAMYRIMGERPMTIRYLDPPLHELDVYKRQGSPLARAMACPSIFT